MHPFVLPCDGIGQEITNAAISGLEAASRRLELKLTFDYETAGFEMRTQDHGGKIQCDAFGREVAKQIAA